MNRPDLSLAEAEILATADRPRPALGGLRHYCSFGGGVQSTTMMLLAMERHPELLRVSGGMVPEAYFFADTGDEPESVYRHVWQCASVVDRPIFVTRGTRGPSLSQHVLDRAERGARGTSCPPLFVLTRSGEAVPIRRGCTQDFKVVPLDRLAKKHFDIDVRRTKEPVVVQWLGISADEAQRTRTAKERWRLMFYPLCEMGWRRGRCIEFLRSRGWSDVPRSACVYCPFHSNEEWRRLQKAEPKEFAKAVDFEHRLHAAWDEHGMIGGLESKPFLHRSRIPIDEVEFTGGQMDLWGNECAGVCGV